MQIKTASIWIPRNSTSREGKHQQGGGGGSAGGGCSSGGLFSGFTGLTGSGTATARTMATPHSSHLPFWSRERALAEGGEKIALRSAPYPPPPSAVSGYANANVDGSVSCHRRLLFLE